MEGLPLIPGYSFRDPCETRFHLSQQFGYKNGYPVPCKFRSGIGQNPLDVESISYLKDYDTVRYDPSLTYGKVKQKKVPPFIPHFVRYNNKRITFQAYFKQIVPESPLECCRIRHVNIIYFLEDDTITVMEPPVDNSGFVQGRLIKRGKIPKNDNGDSWHWKDFNIGMDITFFGIVFHIVDCDAFTKEYLKSQGVELKNPEEMPSDPYLLDRQMRLRTTSCKIPSSDTKFRQSELDGRILRFFAAWDNRDEEFGDMKPFVIYYYLADDTVQIQEVRRKNDGCDPFPLLLKKMKLPKNLKSLPVDFPSLYSDASDATILEYYTPDDFLVGTTISILGRKFIIYDADYFTRQYFQKTLNVIQPVHIKVFENPKPAPPLQIPPHIGIGTPEDSYQSCLQLMPKPPKKDVIRYIINANKFLRYTAKLDWVHPEDAIREFILSYSLFDCTVSIQEPPLRNSGIVGGPFLKSMRLPKPGCNSVLPEYYTPADFYIGAKVEVFRHIFIITGADLFVYNYMQDNQDKFPPMVIDNVRNWLIKQRLLAEEVPCQAEQIAAVE